MNLFCKLKGHDWGVRGYYRVWCNRCGVCYYFEMPLDKEDKQK